MIRGSDIGKQSPFKAGLEPVLQPKHLLGRAVGGKDDLLFQLVQGIEGMEHLLLGGIPAGNELYIVHEKNISPPVLVPELLVPALPDGGDQLVGKGVPLDIDNFISWIAGVYGVGDGIEQMGLSQAGVAENKQGIVVFSRIVGYFPGCGVGQLVRGTHHKVLEGVLLGAG